MPLRFRQESGEVTPSGWLAGGSITTTVALGALGCYNLIGTSSAIVLAVAFGVIATICFLAAGRQHYINVGAERATTMPLAIDPPSVATPQPSLAFQPVPNVSPVLSAWRYVIKLAEKGRLQEVKPRGLDLVGARALPPQHQFQAACASFRNDSRGDRPVATATHVRARINVGHDVDQVTGHWLLSGYDYVDLVVDAGARDLVVAVRDSEGKILLVDDRQGSGGCVEYPILHMRGITNTSYSMAIALSSGGVVLGEFEYVLTVTPFELKPVTRPASATTTA